MIVLRDEPFDRIVAHPVGADIEARRWIEGKIWDDLRAASEAGVHLFLDVDIHPWNTGWEVLTFSPYAEIEA